MLRFIFVGLAYGTFADQVSGSILQSGTYDVTNQTDSASLARACPGIFDVDNSQEPRTWSVIHMQNSSPRIQDSLNAMCPTPNDWLAINKTTRIRFGEVPSEGFRCCDFSVGLAHSDTFTPGINIEGIFQGSQGNLQSKGAGLVVEFTSSLDGGVFTDWYIHPQASSIEIYIVTGGVRYGHAFHVPSNNVSSLLQKLHPTVTFSSECTKMAVALVMWHPSELEKETYERKQTIIGPGILGEWKGGDKVVLKIKERKNRLNNLESKIHVQVQIVNIINLNYTLGPLGQVIGKPLISQTLMMGSEESMRVESEVIGLLSSATKVGLDEFRALVIQSPYGKLKFERFTDTADHSVAVNPWQSSLDVKL